MSIYVTVGCPSVCPVDREQQRRAAGLLQLGRGHQISTDRVLPAKHIRRLLRQLKVKGVNSLPKSVTRQRRGCDLNPSAPESSTLTTRLPSHPWLAS